MFWLVLFLTKENCMKHENYIKLDDCIDKNLYLVNARNASFGIFIKDKNYFMISRYKFKLNYIDFEFHWDFNYGTCQPLIDLGQAEVKDLNDENECLNYLNGIKYTNE